MKVLVVGSGGREHALCWKLAQSPLLESLTCAPGNPGIGEVAERVPVAADDVEGLVQLAAAGGFDLTVVGPEAPLTLGLVDALVERGLAAFGPGREAARLEGSKVFAKLFMERHGIPTARFEVTESPGEARAAAAALGLPVVLKADGLAAGKGVLIPRDARELEEALEVFFEERRFGASGDRVVVEECLRGEEVSIIALADGERVLPFVASKDYKRIGENDEGPNTGGMGAHSPSGVLDREGLQGVVETVLRPTIRGMARDGRPFAGVLYAGLMLTPEGPRTLEFNVRFGDPECQPLMLRLESDLLPALAVAANGGFGDLELSFRDEAAACIVLASAGYPRRPVVGEAIEGLEEAARHEDTVVFHAGTGKQDGRLVATGGRVLNVCSLGASLGEALERAYAAAEEIRWPSRILRRDIGRRVLR